MGESLFEPVALLGDKVIQLANHRRRCKHCRATNRKHGGRRGDITTPPSECGRGSLLWREVQELKNLTGDQL